jgi:hypothetical protein
MEQNLTMEQAEQQIAQLKEQLATFQQQKERLQANRPAVSASQAPYQKGAGSANALAVALPGCRMAPLPSRPPLLRPHVLTSATARTAARSSALPSARRCCGKSPFYLPFNPLPPQHDADPVFVCRTRLHRYQCRAGASSRP